jgi:hypothetical protein
MKQAIETKVVYLTMLVIAYMLIAIMGPIPRVTQYPDTTMKIYIMCPSRNDGSAPAMYVRVYPTMGRKYGQGS